MRDTLKNQKDTLVNFVNWLNSREVPSGAAWLGARTVQGAPDPVQLDALLESFLATQHSGSRYVPCCGHCGSDSVTEGRFENQSAPFALTADMRASWQPGAGAAWVCYAKDCGHYTVREE